MTQALSPVPEHLKAVLGKTPLQWKLERLKYAIQGVEQGWSPQCHATEAGPGEWGVLKVGCVNGAEFDERENKALPEDLEPLPELEIKPDDILMSRANTRELLGSAVLVRSCRSKLMLCDKLFRIRVDRQVFDPRFLVYSFASGPSRFQFEGDATGTSGSMKNIGQDTLRNLWIALPPLDQQRAIAAFLDRETARIDELIAKKERLIELLEQKRAEVIDAIIKTWATDSSRVERLKFSSQFVTSGSRGWAEFYSDEGPVFLRIGNLTRASVDVDLADIQRVQPPDGAEGVRTRAQEDDLLISITAYIGAVGVVPSGLGEAYVSQHLALVRFKDDSVNPRWVAYCLLSRHGQDQFRASLYGGTKDGLSLGDVRNLTIPKPDRAVQDSNVYQLDSLSATLSETRRKLRFGIDRLREYRSALISAAVTGQIDVREEAH